MGSNIGPRFTNIFVNRFESKHLPNSPSKPILWRSYIDDICCAFLCSDAELSEITELLHNFTAESNPDGIRFLNTFVSIRRDNPITTPHTEPSDTTQYLAPNSCHPKHITNSKPFCQGLKNIQYILHMTNAVALVSYQWKHPMKQKFAALNAISKHQLPHIEYNWK